MGLIRSLHVALLSTDLDRSRCFYEGGLGLVPVDRPLGFPGVWYQLDGFQIHLIAAATMTDSAVATLCDRVDDDRWGRNRHLAFAVDDLAEMADRLRQQGYEIQRSASGRSALFTQDPDGNVIELSQLD
jgi:glyoxylase I family protein